MDYKFTMTDVAIITAVIGMAVAIFAYAKAWAKGLKH